MAQLLLFEIATPQQSAYNVAITPEVERALADHAPIAIGVSGGKDSSAIAIRTFEYLDDCGHRGPRLLIDWDLGEIEFGKLPEVYRQLVALEAESSFSFQPGRWLGDVAPHLLSADVARHLARAKDFARQREAWDSQILEELLLSKGVPGRLLLAVKRSY